MRPRLCLVFSLSDCGREKHLISSSYAFGTAFSSPFMSEVSMAKIQKRDLKFYIYLYIFISSHMCRHI